ncbi:hypothetical protein BCF33_2499 [Hasllibacter halocynthiae]|uniref:YcxB-like protein n=1 Tax=Hasllibacter halocynthiae TaxID=595589 RepID=A0A2T0X3U8_9RHOB|nr:hypothetical protein [Hasllibacter halocynthiae]PRY93619.1 hypothetical protein BCF33_2499 [Hasllibacter halocynthiae]
MGSVSEVQEGRFMPDVAFLLRVAEACEAAAPLAPGERLRLQALIWPGTILVIVGIVALICAAWIGLGADRAPPVWLLALAGGVCGSLTIRLPPVLGRAFDQVSARRTLRLCGGETRFAIGPKGIAVDRGALGHRIGWVAVREVMETPELIGVVADGGAWAAPRGAFPDPGAALAAIGRRTDHG